MGWGWDGGGQGSWEGEEFRRLGGLTSSSLAGTRSEGLEAKRKVVETWRGGATSEVRLRWSSAWMAWVAGAKDHVGSEVWWSPAPLVTPSVEGDMLC